MRLQSFHGTQGACIIARVSEPLPPRLVELLNRPTGVVALAATHLETGRRTWRHNERVVTPSASLIKLPILAAFWEAAEAGRVDPSEW